MSAPASVAVIGGGIAGVTVARELRAGGYDGQLTIIEAEPACYDRPPLSKAAFVDGAALTTLAFATPEEFASDRIEIRSATRAVGIAAPHDGAGRVELADGRTVEADAIVIASGARARPPAFPGGTLPAVGVLRDYADAARLRAAARTGSAVLVVGGGFIGAELASGLVALGAHVTLVDRNAVPGVGALGALLAEHLHAMHAAHGVDVRVGTVVEVTPSAAGNRVDARLDDGRLVSVDAVAVGTGIEADPALAVSAGVASDGGIIVDDAGRTSAPGVWAVGDATRRRRPDGTLAPTAGHWEAARLDAEAVAADILGGTVPARGAEWLWSDRYDVHLEVVGRLGGEGREVVRRTPDGLPQVVLRHEDGVLVGAASINDPNAVRAARRLIDRRIPVSEPQLADPAVSLRDLLRAAR